MGERASIYLVGFMGSGKSTVGAELAAALGLEPLDTDAELERRHGATIAELIEARGEPAFRALECELLERSIAGRPAVVATGGGLPTTFRARRVMRATGRSVWLDASLRACAARVGGGAGRPLWRTEDPLALRALFERRRALYALADARVPADDEPAEVARRARAALGAAGRPGRQR